MYQILSWAQHWAVDELFGVHPEQLNDDRLGRCLDALAPHVDPIQGSITVAAVREFDLNLSPLHWDLTSVVLQGEYPPEEQDPNHPKPTYGFGGDPQCKQVRVGELVTGDGGVPVWHHAFDGNQADVGSVVAQMEAFRKQIELPECLVIGDSKLLTQEVIPKLLGQGVHFLAPLPKSPDLDQEYRGLDEEGWERLEYLAQRQQRLPPQEHTEYLGQEVAGEGIDPNTGKRWPLRKLFVISSEERATCRKVRDQQRTRAEAELAKIQAGLGKRQLTTAAQVEARVAQVLKARRVAPLYQVTVTGEGATLTLTREVDPEALSRAEALDGYYVLLCSLPCEQADSNGLLRRWKRETVIERRFSDWKGPLRVRPVFVTSNARMAAFVLLLHLSLVIYCLMEREARRQLAAQGRQKLERLLAGHVAAVPTGENILGAFEHLYLIVDEDELGRHSEMSAMSPEQRELGHLLGLQRPVCS